MLVLAALAGTVFYFRADLAVLYLSLSQKIQNFEKTSVDSLLSKTGQQVNAPPPIRAQKETLKAQLTKSGTIKWTNSQRSDNGLPILAENKNLDQAALSKAQDMFKKQYFAHESPTGAGPAEVAKAAGYDFLIIGENLALGNFANDQELVQAWMDSPGHRANILNSKYKEIGVAVLHGTYENKSTWIAVQEFGLPSAACPQINSALKNSIDLYQKQLDDLSSLLVEKKAELGLTSPRRNPDLYNQKVDEYNKLVNQYNSLLARTKSLIDNYNSQVRALNACVTGQ